MLVHEIAHELGLFLEDATADIVAARLGLNANEEIQRFVSTEHPDATGPTLLKDLQHRRHRKPVMQQLRSASTQRGRQEIYQYRSLTLGGRVTARAASASVRRQEVLMAAEEVMVAVAHDLVAAGYRLLGLAGNEFVLEISGDKASEHCREKIASVVHEASRRILAGLRPSVILGSVETW